MTAAWMNKSELASYLGYATRTIDRWRKIGYLPKPRYIAGRPRWSAKEIDLWISRQPDFRAS